MRQLEEIITDARYTISHIDDIAAQKLLEELGQFVLAQNLQQSDPGLLQKLQKLMLQLKIVNFPNLSENDATEILRNHYLDSFEIEVPMENRLTAMLFFYPEIPRDDLRKKLKSALLENQQRLGPLTVTQWIAEFEKMFDVHSRKISASVEFVSKHPQAIFLSPIEKSRLQELLYTYDYLLITTLPATGPILDQVLATSTAETAYHSEETSNRINQTNNTVSSRNNYTQNLVTLPLPDAMKQFPEIGEQMITSERISLKNFPDQVRPSLKNWLADYVFTVGHDNTDSVKRGEYLFHSQNTMRLSGNDRQRLAYILKAHDENSEIAIDREGRQIVFEMPEANQPTIPTGPTSKNIPSENRSAQPQSSTTLHNSVSFSSPQQLPYEKLSAAPQPAQNEMLSRVKFPPIQQSRPTNPVNNIVKLEPKPEAPREFPRNVVNLRDE